MSQENTQWREDLPDDWDEVPQNPPDPLHPDGRDADLESRNIKGEIVMAASKTEWISSRLSVPPEMEPAHRADYLDRLPDEHPSLGLKPFDSRWEWCEEEKEIKTR